MQPAYELMNKTKTPKATLADRIAALEQKALEWSKQPPVVEPETFHIPWTYAPLPAYPCGGHWEWVPHYQPCYHQPYITWGGGCATSGYSQPVDATYSGNYSLNTALNTQGVQV
jgi:hypothetical protein